MIWWKDDEEKTMGHDLRHDPVAGKRTPSNAKWIFVGFALIAGYFLVTEHQAHLSSLLGYWPLLLVLACPIMHIFMHGGHGGHGNHEDDRGTRSDKPSKGEKS